jgi:hypothetical protein
LLLIPHYNETHTLNYDRLSDCDSVISSSVGAHKFDVELPNMMVVKQLALEFLKTRGIL